MMSWIDGLVMSRSLRGTASERGDRSPKRGVTALAKEVPPRVGSSVGSSVGRGGLGDSIGAERFPERGGAVRGSGLERGSNRLTAIPLRDVLAGSTRRSAQRPAQGRMGLNEVRVVCNDLLLDDVRLIRAKRAALSERLQLQARLRESWQAVCRCALLPGPWDLPRLRLWVTKYMKSFMMKPW